MYLLYFLIILIFLIISLCVMLRPYFSLAILAIISAIFLFILTEQWTTHNANEFENRFWSSIAFSFSMALVFISDSPFRFCSESRLGGFALVLLFTYIIHNYDRHLRRLVLRSRPDIKRNRSLNFVGNDRLNAQKKLKVLDELIQKIDPHWVSSALLNTFMPVMKDETEIIKLFAEATPYELNYIVKEIALGLIFYKVKDHRFFNNYNRTALLHLLFVERVAELNLYSRALLLHGLQQMKLSANIHSEELAKNVILKTSGDDLSELKSLMDSKGDFNSMHKLVYVDIRNPSTQKEILDHIRKEAKFMLSHMSLGTKLSKRRKQFAWRKILSDVDDTLTCSGGSFPAGVDDTYPRKAVYPGVLAFYRELDLGTAGDHDEWNRQERLGNLVFLSARPHVYKDISEKHSYEKFRKLLDSGRLHTSPTLLAGSLDTGSQFLRDGSLEPLARKKFENYAQYFSLYPEYRCIFIGDNGQGDVRTSEMILDDSVYSGTIQRVYVHQVLPRHKTYTVHESTRGGQHPKICYFQSYVDAGIDAWRSGLIRVSGLRRIAKEALEDFDRIASDTWASVTGGLSARESRRQELRAAVVRANDILERERRLPPVPLPLLPKLYPRGTAVRTAFGGGVVTSFRRDDGIYEVLLQWDGTGISKPVKCFVTQANINPVTRPLHPQGLVSVANPVSVKGARPDKAASIIGSRCWSEFGLCRLLRLRPELRDRGRVEVVFDWGGKGFLKLDCLVVLAYGPHSPTPTSKSTPPGSPPLLGTPPPLVSRFRSLRPDSLPPPFISVDKSV